MNLTGMARVSIDVDDRNFTTFGNPNPPTVIVNFTTFGNPNPPTVIVHLEFNLKDRDKSLKDLEYVMAEARRQALEVEAV